MNFIAQAVDRVGRTARAEAQPRQDRGFSDGAPAQRRIADERKRGRIATEYLQIVGSGRVEGRIGKGTAAM